MHIPALTEMFMLWTMPRMGICKSISDRVKAIFEAPACSLPKTSATFLCFRRVLKMFLVPGDTAVVMMVYPCFCNSSKHSFVEWKTVKSSHLFADDDVALPMRRGLYGCSFSKTRKMF